MKKIIQVGIWVLNIVVLGIIIMNIGIILVSPKNNQEDFGRDVVFKWGGRYKNYDFTIDDNEDFTSPIMRAVTGNYYVIDNLEPGVYYWKIRSGRVSSPVWRFEIKSMVGIDLIESEDGFVLKNSGNVDEVVVAGNPITGAVVIDLPYDGQVEIEKVEIEKVEIEKNKDADDKVNETGERNEADGGAWSFIAKQK